MELFHTSPSKIETIRAEDGRFGEFLFFSSGVYSMSGKPNSELFVYAIEIDNGGIIDAGSLFYHEHAAKLDALVAEVAGRFDIDTDTAEALLSERRQVHELDGIEPEDMADASWDMQLYTARAAKLLGFRGVRVSDEQGTAYMIDMLGRESDLRGIQ